MSRSNNNDYPMIVDSRIREFFSSIDFKRFLVVLFFSSCSVAIPFFLLSIFFKLTQVVQNSLNITDQVLYSLAVIVLPYITYMALFRINSRFKYVDLNKYDTLNTSIFFLNIIAITILIVLVLSGSGSAKLSYFATFPVHIWLLVTPFFFHFVVYNKDLDSFFVDHKIEKLDIRQLIFGFLFYVASLILMNLILYILKDIVVIDNYKVIDVINSMDSSILLFAIIFVPITEELFFRGFLLKRAGLLTSSFIFALFHLSYLSIVQLIASFVIGVVLGLVYTKSNLNTCIFTHFFFNFFSIIAIKILQVF
ncbi:MAG: CPBP family intramembrane metalloprotease [Candidatus Micrarchaeota archaeon]|nr:CPBP family intramembrane metalloprotease [Candidatus Micrarchaeota archaeon]